MKTLAVLAANPAQSTISPSSIKPLTLNKNSLKLNMNAINATIETQSDEQSLTLDCELLPVTHKTFKRYAGKVRLLANIHKEIALILTARQEACAAVYHRYEDRFIDMTAKQSDNETLLNFDTKQAVIALPLP
jgi:hypothetical protein